MEVDDLKTLPALPKHNFLSDKVEDIMNKQRRNSSYDYASNEPEFIIG